MEDPGVAALLNAEVGAAAEESASVKDVRDRL